MFSVSVLFWNIALEFDSMFSKEIKVFRRKEELSISRVLFLEILKTYEMKWLLINTEFCIDICDSDSANIKLPIKFPITSTSRILTKDLCTINTKKTWYQLTFDGPLQFLICIFWISIAQL